MPTLRRFERPAWTTGILIPLSFLCGIFSGVFIWRGGQQTKRTARVESRLRAALAMDGDKRAGRHGSRRAAAAAAAETNGVAVGVADADAPGAKSERSGEYPPLAQNGRAPAEEGGDDDDDEEGGAGGEGEGGQLLLPPSVSRVGSREKPLRASTSTDGLDEKGARRASVDVASTVECSEDGREPAHVRAGTHTPSIYIEEEMVVPPR